MKRCGWALRGSCRRAYSDVPLAVLMAKAWSISRPWERWPISPSSPSHRQRSLRDDLPFGMFAVPASGRALVRLQASRHGQAGVVAYLPKEDINVWADLVAPLHSRRQVARQVICCMWRYRYGL